MGVGLDRAEIVDRDDLDVVAARFDDGAQHVAADAAEAVDGDFGGHWAFPLLMRSLARAATASAVMPKWR